VNVRELGIDGAFLIDGTQFADARGDFRRLVELNDLPALSVDLKTAYVASAHNARAGTVRGLHFQESPYEEAKVLWCHAGSMYDVLVDARREAPTFGTWVPIELSSDITTVVCVPRGVAHGYQTTAPNTGVTYLISGEYQPSSSRTIYWRDETLSIPWPLADAVVSPSDAAAPGWSEFV
jgi:dTDP-4-dehydrorhamnose 3,5-epimerase